MELTADERAALLCFRVTGLFNKTPKREVGRFYDVIGRALVAANPQITIGQAQEVIKSLGQKGLLALDNDKGAAQLTEKGYEEILQMK